MTTRLFELSTTDPEETAHLAEQIGALLDCPAVLCLDGVVGGGKTHFCRALIQSLQHQPEDVPSPTFTLVQTYDSKKGPIWHADLYRLGHPDEAIELGLTEAFETAICLIEWPDRLGDLIPSDALWLKFATGQGEADRQISGYSANADRWEDLQRVLAHV